MPTPAQIDEQINHERDAIAQGLKLSLIHI